MVSNLLFPDRIEKSYPAIEIECVFTNNFGTCFNRKGCFILFLKPSENALVQTYWFTFLQTNQN